MTQLALHRYQMDHRRKVHSIQKLQPATQTQSTNKPTGFQEASRKSQMKRKIRGIWYSTYGGANNSTKGATTHATIANRCGHSTYVINYRVENSEASDRCIFTLLGDTFLPMACQQHTMVCICRDKV